MLTGTGDDQSVLTHVVTPNYFSVLGVRAQLGIATVDDAEGRPRAVIGHRLWQQRFGGSPQIVGKTILLNKKAVLVAGVMPAEFIGLNRGVTTDVWVNFKVFGILPLTLLFAMTQLPLMMRHEIKPEEDVSETHF